MWRSLGRLGPFHGFGRLAWFHHSRRAVALALMLAIVAACRDGPGSAATSGATAPPGVLQPNATVLRVVDGDTVDVVIHGHHERIRLIGIDTPETKDPDKPVQCYGPEASARTEARLLPGTAVRLERDVEARDDYGRLLAYVYRAGDGLFVNLDLARAGAAAALTIQPNVAHEREIAAAVEEARRAGRGRWGACRDP